MVTKDKAEHEQRLKEFWENLKPFKTYKDIPTLPQAPKDEWDNFYVPILIRCGAIPIDQLEDGECYEGDCRNANITRWDAQKQRFIYWRHKWGDVFEDSVNHFQMDDGNDLFTPIKKITREEYDQTK